MFISFLLLLMPGLAHSRNVEHEMINCKDFNSQQCLDLAFDYYGLTPETLNGYGAMQQAILSDTIECHYIYDICPFHIPRIEGQKKECIDGKIEFIDEFNTKNYYQCLDVDLLSFVPITELGSNNNASGADIWGYQTVDSKGNVNAHYAITSQADGASVVDITDALNPNVLAFIVSNVHGELRNVLWRDVKVYKEFAIVVADTGGINDHGIQLFNITQVVQDATQFQNTNPVVDGRKPVYNVPKKDVIVYDRVGRCHNVYVDNDIGNLYAVGSEGVKNNKCGSGLHIIDIKDPTKPKFVNCYDDAKYVHDILCVLYHGPDQIYYGHEICFMFTPDVGNLTIVDITNPDDIIEISSTTYYTSSYNHQGWVTGNHEYLLLDDECDEGPIPDRYPKTQNRTTTYIFDIRDLDNPDYVNAYHSHILAVDHNQYILDNGDTYSCSHDEYKGYTFQANYEAGLRILNIDNIANEKNNQLEEIAYFDLYPWKYHANGSAVHDNIKFFGAWSVYPYFNQIGTNPKQKIASKTIVVHSSTTGLYVLSFDKNVFSRNNESESKKDGFKWQWNAWYSILINVAVGLVIILCVVKYCCKTRSSKSKRKSDVYQRVVDVEQAAYGTNV